jgi:hypothetical protein
VEPGDDAPVEEQGAFSDKMRSVVDQMGGAVKKDTALNDRKVVTHAIKLVLALLRNGEPCIWCTVLALILAHIMK